MKIIRQIDVYDKITEELVDEIPVPELNLSYVKQLIKPSKYDPDLYYQYNIEGVVQDYFEQMGFSFDQKKHLYFLCCYQDK